jgi:hypothetical protein
MIDIATILDTAVSNRRRSQRVFLKIRVVARFRLLERDWIVDGDTVVVSAHGGTLRLPVAPMAVGDVITLSNPATDQAETCRVVRVELMQSNLVEATSSHSIEPTPSRSAEVMQSRLVQAMQHRIARSRSSRLVHPAPRRPSTARPGQVFEVAFAFDHPAPHFWAVAFPPTDWIESLVNH